MNNARNRILANIRTRLRDHPHGELIKTRDTHVKLQAEAWSADELFKRFCEGVSASRATFSVLNNYGAIAEATASYLQAHKRNAAAIPLHLNCPSLVELAWPERDLWLTNIHDATASITKAFCAIAETGSLALVAAPGYSSAAYFLPEVLLVVVDKSTLVATQEACWAKLHQELDALPRSVTLVTGPSRTGDIEQQLVIGAHGPRHTHVLIIEQPVFTGL